MPKIEQCILSERIYYEIVSNCNLKCIHCSDILSQQGGKKLSLSEIIEFHKNMVNLYNINEAVVTGGEPSLHPDFYQIVEELAKLGKVLITTNGTRINIEKMEELFSKYQNITLQISIDGKSKETFEKIRGEGTYAKTYGLIEKLVEDGYQDKIGVSMTIMQYNSHEVMEMIEYCELKGLAFIYFPVLLPTGNALRHWNDIAPNLEQEKRIEDEIFSIIADYEGDLQIISNRLNQICSKIISKNEIDCLKSFTIKVCPNKNIMPCPISSMNEHMIGTIDEDDIGKKIEGRLTKIKEKSRQLRYSNKEKCSKCEIEEFCTGNFCASCQLLMNKEEHDAESYFCSITQYHINNALNGV